MSKLRRVLLEALGWLLTLAGIAALVLPGPGLLLLFAGLALLAREYEWARRRLDPVRLRALRSAADGVATWPRTLMSAAGVAGLAAVGAVFVVEPPPPTWWPGPDRVWLAGGWQTGATLLLSAAVAAALLVVSFRRFHADPEARAELERELVAADRSDED